MIPGAGYDARAYRFEALKGGIKVSGADFRVVQFALLFGGAGRLNNAV